MSDNDCNFIIFKDGDRVRLKGPHMFDGGRARGAVRPKATGIVRERDTDGESYQDKRLKAHCVVHFDDGYGAHWVQEDALDFIDPPVTDDEVQAAIASIAQGAIDLSHWRENRGSGWHQDVGYRLQDTLRMHRYEYERKGSKPDDPGWHECTCGWEGYWSSFEPHVADHLRAVVMTGAVR